MAAGQVERERVLAAVAAIQDGGALPGRLVRDAAGSHPDPRIRGIDSESDGACRTRQQGARFGIVGVDRRAARDGEEIAEQAAQFFHALVVEADIEQHGHTGPV